MTAWLRHERRGAWALVFSLSLAILALGLVLHGEALAPAGTVEGMVRDASGPVAGARVRVRNTENATLTDADGLFSLGGLDEGLEIEITAWDDGYYIASTHVTPTVAGLTLTLRPYHQVDNPGYAWPSPISGTSPGACGNCHPMIITQWISNAHGTAVSNPRFYSLYNGTDVTGAVIQGDGYLDDFPGTAGTCTNCHAPGLGVDSYLTTNMNDARDQVTAGIHCDYCHKIGGVYLDPWTGSVYPNVPGTLSQRVLRPPEGDNIFFGPYDDVHDPDTYLPLISESQFCAPCHQFSFWGTPIYESYEEWLASPYAELWRHLPGLPHAAQRRHLLCPARGGRVGAPAGDDPLPPAAWRDQRRAVAGHGGPGPCSGGAERGGGRDGGHHQHRRRASRAHRLSGPAHDPDGGGQRGRPTPGPDKWGCSARVGRGRGWLAGQGLRQGAARRAQRRGARGQLLEAGPHRQRQPHPGPGRRPVEL